MSSEKRKLIVRVAFSLLGFALLGIAFALAVKWRQSAFDESRVAITIDGPRQAMSNQSENYVLICENNNRATLENVEIFLDYGENFVPDPNSFFVKESDRKVKILIGKIKGRGKKEIAFSGKFYAPRKHMVYLNAVLRYHPLGTSAVFEKQGQVGVEIKSSPLTLNVSAPLDAANGNEVEYKVEYENPGEYIFDDLILEAQYPEGFSFSSAESYPDRGNNIWELGDLIAREKGEITIRGNLDGQRNEGKAIKIFLYSNKGGEKVFYGEEERFTKIIVSPLVILQKLNDDEKTNINQGQILNYSLIYRNEGEIGLRDVIITLKIKEPKGNVLDYSRLNPEDGAYDSSTQTIIWRASHIKNLSYLAPGASGEIRFSVPVKEKIDIADKDKKNFIVETIAEIDSPDVPLLLASNKIISSNKLTLKLNSKVILDVLGFYNDSNLKNQGPIPPQVGKETDYAIHWKITNVSNDLENTEVSAFLPPGVKWKGMVYPEKEEDKIEFNPRSNQIIWKIGKLNNGVGIIRPVREISFQVSVVPEEHQKGNPIKLLEKSILSAQDLFTGEKIYLEVKEKNSYLSEDSGLNAQNYNVVSMSEE